MKVITSIGNMNITNRYNNPDQYINMVELDSAELKTNHLNLFLKTKICELYPDMSIEKINTAIDSIDLSIFIRGISEKNNSVITLLAKNVVFQFARIGEEVSFSSIYDLLNISKSISD